MTPNWAGPAVSAGSRRTATRVTFGAISLKSSSHFAVDTIFDHRKSGGVSTRSREAIDEAGADRVAGHREYDGDGTGRLQQRSYGRSTARMTSGASATNSAACLRMRSASPAPQRMSIRILRSSIQPNCCRPCRNAGVRADNSGSSAPCSSGRRSAASALAAARAPLAATQPPPHRAS